MKRLEHFLFDSYKGMSEALHLVKQLSVFPQLASISRSRVKCYIVPFKFFFLCFKIIYTDILWVTFKYLKFCSVLLRYFHIQFEATSSLWAAGGWETWFCISCSPRVRSVWMIHDSLMTFECNSMYQCVSVKQFHRYYDMDGIGNSIGIYL